MEVTILSRGGGIFREGAGSARPKKQFAPVQPCRLHRFRFIGGETELECLGESSVPASFPTPKKPARSSIRNLEDGIFFGTRTCDAVDTNSPFVSRLLMCCNDVESNPGPLTATANDDNSSTGSSKSNKAKPTPKDRQAERQAERERSTVSAADRLSKYERSLIR